MRKLITPTILILFLALVANAKNAEEMHPNIRECVRTNTEENYHKDFAQPQASLAHPVEFTGALLQPTTMLEEPVVISDITNYVEGFDNDGLPNGWQSTTYNGCYGEWNIGTMSTQFGSGNYAYMDGTTTTNDVELLTNLITCTYDLSAYANVSVSFVHDYDHIEWDDYASFSYSIDNGATWVQDSRWNESSPNDQTEHHEFYYNNLKSSSVKFKFTYRGRGNRLGHWYIDDFRVYGDKTILPAPSYNPKYFKATTQSTEDIKLTWENPFGIDSYNYLIEVNTTGVFSKPYGEIINDLNIYDGSGTVNVLNGGETYTFHKLRPGTKYYFRIVPYTNTGGQVKYIDITSKIPPTASAITQEYVCTSDVILPGYIETFDDTQIPLCWTTTDNTSSGVTWEFGKSGTFGTGNYTSVNSISYQSPPDINSDLISREFDFSNYRDIVVSFDQDYRTQVGYYNTTATFWYSIDNGTTWTKLLTHTINNNNSPFSKSLPELNGQSKVRFKFNYKSIQSYYWHIDNFSITGTPKKAEPTNHVTALTATSNSSSEITVTWNDATGEVQPDGYLVLTNTTGIFSAPSDFSVVADDTNLNDDAGIINVAYGVGQHKFTGLKSNTKYYYKVYPYTNNSIIIDYKTDGLAPKANTTTQQDPCAIDIATAGYSEGFETSPLLGIPSCTSIENTNNDTKMWRTMESDPRTGSHYLEMIYSTSLAMNDWFFSAPLLLEAGSEYELSYWYRGNYGYTEKMEVKLLSANNSQSQVVTLANNTAITNYTYSEQMLTFSPPYTGVFFIGWHAYSAKSTWRILIDDISVIRKSILNNIPVASNPIPDIKENEGFATKSINIGEIFSDIDGDPLTFSATSNDETVVSVAVTDNMLTISEVGYGESDITITASDGKVGGTGLFQFNISVNATPLVVTTLENLNLTKGFSSNNIDVSGIFRDPENEALTLTAASSNESIVTADINSNILTIHEVGTGIATVTLSANDGKGGIISIQFLVSVNSNPVVTSPIEDIYTTEGFGSITLDVTSLFSDAEGDILSLGCSSSDATVSSISLIDGMLYITEGTPGTCTVTITANDGKEGTASTSFNVFVNAKPKILNPIYDDTYAEGFGYTEYDLSTYFYDEDGDILTYTASSSSIEVATTSISGNILRITEVAPGQTTITVAANDGKGGVTNEGCIFRINANPIVANPLSDIIVTEPFFSLPHIDLTDVFYDAEGEAFTYSIVISNPAITNAYIEGSILTISPYGGVFGTTTITVYASTNGIQVSSQFQATLNAAPNANQSFISHLVQEGFATSTLNLNTLFTDADGDALSYSARSDSPSIATVSVEGSLLTISEGSIGSTQLVVTASDGKGGLDYLYITFICNAYPSIISPINNMLLTEGFVSTTIDLSNVFTDRDGDALSFDVFSTNPEVAQTSIQGYTLTIEEVAPGSTDVMVMASDGKGGSSSVPFTLTINSNPIVIESIDDLATSLEFPNFEFDISGIFADPDGDALAYSVESSNDGVANVSVNQSRLTITAIGSGNTNITLTASDGKGGSATEVFLFTCNSNPTINNPINDLNITEGFVSTTVDLSNVFTDSDGDVLSFEVSSNNSEVAMVSVQGLTLTITEVAPGSALVTITATDGKGGLNSILFTVTINSNPIVIEPINDMTTSKDLNSFDIDLSWLFSDPDGDALSFAAVSSNTSVVTVAVEQSILTLFGVGQGSSTITITATDGKGGAVNEEFTISLIDNFFNTVPSVVNPIADINTSQGFATINVSLAGVFSDPDGDALTLTAASSNGDVVTVTVTGETLTLTEVGSGTVSITVTADDGRSGYASTTFSVAVVQQGNSAPVVATPIADIGTSQGFATMNVSLVGVFSDPDGDALTLTAASTNPDVITVTASNNNLTITEIGTGAATVILNAFDGKGGMAATQFNININSNPIVIEPINDMTTSKDLNSFDIDLSWLFSDPDGDALSFAAVSSNNSVVTVAVEQSILTIFGVGQGSSTITITATDGKGGAVTEEFTISLIDNFFNTVPSVVNPIADINTSQGFATMNVSLAGVFSDPDGDALTLTAASSNGDVVTVTVTGETLTLAEVGSGTASITVTADDGRSGYASTTFSVAVAQQGNSAPVVATPIADIGTSQGFATMNVSLEGVFSDPDGDALTLTAASSNGNVVTVTVTGETLTLAEVGSGTASITVTADDGRSGYASTTFSVAVAQQGNSVPVVVTPIADISTSQGFATMNVSLAGVFSDPDGDALTLTAASNNGDVVTVTVTGETLTLAEVGCGTASITVTADDSRSGYASTTFSVAVAQQGNSAPVVATPIADIGTSQGFATMNVSLAGVFSDPDGDALTLTAASSNGDVVTVTVTGETLTLAEVGSGTASITVTADDGRSGYASTTFSVAVAQQGNSAPVVVTPIADIGTNQGFATMNVSLAGVFSDPDGDALTLTAASSNGDVVTVTVTGETLTLAEVGSGTAIVTVTADDGRSGYASTTFSVAVAQQGNSAPVVVTPIADIGTNQGFATMNVSLAGVFSDPDGDALTLTAASSNGNVVTVTVTGETLTLAEVGSGTASITVTADDGRSGYASTTFSIAVAQQGNSAPVVVTPIADISTSQGFATMNVSLAGVFSDPDGDALTLTAASSNGDVVTVTVTGETLTLAEVGSGTASITVTADDGRSGYASTTFSVAVAQQGNSAPVVATPIADIGTSQGFATMNVSLAGVFSDPDGDALTLTAASSNGNVVTVTVTGETLTLAEVGCGTASITVTADDGKGGFVENIFTITITTSTFADYSKDINFSTYPNPADEFIFIQLTNSAVESLTMELYNINGQLVKSCNLPTSLSEEPHRIDVSMLTPGIYFIRLHNSNSSTTQKVSIK